MSWQSYRDPAPAVVQVADAIEAVIVPRARDLAGFEVGHNSTFLESLRASVSSVSR